MKPKTIITILKFAASIGLISWLIYSRKEQFTAFLDQDKNLAWLALGCVTMTAAFTISYVRWKMLANAIRLDLTVKEAVKLGFIGSFFNVVAFGVVGGDSLRAYYAARSKKDRVPEAILSVFIDRAIGLMVMFGFAGLSWQLSCYLSDGSIGRLGGTVGDRQHLQHSRDLEHHWSCDSDIVSAVSWHSKGSSVSSFDSNSKDW